ncbi:MAG TPA: SIR2 family protein [Polyangia bacterium]|nr:SIR2 family protein [Polyangia bacterium]HVZ23312.1 SIR2 family protein [Vicinamibacterales bacterium]
MLHPPASECPLYTGEELWRVEHLADVADAIDRVADQERTSTSTVGTPFEALMNSWVDAEDDRSDYIRCAQRILAMSMLVGRECAFHERPDLFDELLARLVGRRRLMVISLNYDLLFEEALDRAKRVFNYPALEGVALAASPASDVVPVYKLHGSVNWFSARSFSGSADLEIARESSRPVKLLNAGSMIASQTYATYVPKGRGNTFYEWEDGIVTSGPVAAIYGTGKRLLENPEHVQAHRDDCLNSVSGLDRADVVVIGMRPVSAKDDPTTSALMELLARLQGAKIYISPSESDCAAFRKVDFDVRQCGLESWIGELPTGR